MKLTSEMRRNLKTAHKNGLIVPRTENNKYLDISYKGTGGFVSEKWNVKVYTTGSVQTTDSETLRALCAGALLPPDESLRLLQIDDSGWGFPLCGVMVGVSDGTSMMTAVVDVKWFRAGIFESKKYLEQYSILGRQVMRDHFAATPKTHRVEICTGYINRRLKDDLRKEGYDVRVTEIKGFLQNKLEGNFKEYVKKTLRADLAYDPKELKLNKAALTRKFRAVMKWGIQNRPDMLKDGWESIQKLNDQMTYT